MSTTVSLSRADAQPGASRFRVFVRSFSALFSGPSGWVRSLALASLCCIRLWVELYSSTSATGHFATIVTCLILTGIFTLIFRFAPVRICLLTWSAACIFAAKEVFLTIGLLGWKPGFVVTALAVLGFAAVALALRVPVLQHSSTLVRNLSHAAAASILLITTVAMLSSARIALSSVSLIASASPRAVSGAKPKAAAKRVVWIVIDELDEQLAFTQRPAELRMPALDRFRDHAEYRGSAVGSASIPSLLAGRAQAELGGSTVLSRMSAKGLRTAVVGWALPYCQKAGATECASWPEAHQANSYDPLPVWNRFRSFFETERFSPFGYPLAVQHHVAQMEEMERAAVSAAARPELALVFLHLPHARAPFVWDPRTGQPNAEIRPWDHRGELRNLQWADAVFAQIRAGMESSGVWDRSIVLVTSRFEHGGKSPFWLKSPAWVDLDPSEPVDPLLAASMLEGLLLR